MGQALLCYLVCYDIRDPKRWRKAYKILHGYGRPIQYSIFRCQLSVTDFEKLRWELERVLDEEDALLFIGICDGCVQRISARNRKEAWGEERTRFIVA